METGLTNPYLFVTVEDSNSVRLYGLAHSLDEKERVAETIKQIKDIKNISNELVVSSSYF